MAGAVTTASQNLTSTTASVDPYLSIALDANSQYSFTAVLDWSQVNLTDGGFAAGFQISSGTTTLRWTDPNDGTTYGSGSTVSYINTTGARLVELSGTVITGANADTLVVIRGLAQASANVTTFLINSSLVVENFTPTPTPGPATGLQAQTICSLARQIANVPGWTTQSGQLLNTILSDLAQTYDFETNLRTFPLTFDTGTTYQNNVPGAGPNLLPSNFLRAKNNEIIYYINGVRYVLVIQEQDRYDALVQTAGWNSYPTYGYIDLALGAPFDTTNPGQPGLMVWPPASGAFTTQVRYYCQPPTITTPETSTTIPWFPNSTYLYTRLAGELMKLTDDERTASFLGAENEQQDSAQSATSILRKFLKMKDDPENVVKTVRLDRRLFGPQFSNLKNTKQIGW